MFFLSKTAKNGNAVTKYHWSNFSTCQLDEHQEPWATSEPLAMRLPSQTVQVRAAVIIVLLCFLHHHYYCHIHHHHSWEQSNMRRYWSVWKVKRRYEAYAQLELLLLLHTFGDFSSPNWGTVKLKWMLPRTTPRETLLLIQHANTNTKKYIYKYYWIQIQILITFSSRNWGTVKLKWMLPENHTQRNIVTNTTR